jgi:DNA end-binding protein Ku
MFRVSGRERPEAAGVVTPVSRPSEQEQLAMAARAYWQGQIRLALVSIPVQVFSATKSAARVSFNQIHKPTGKRIRYEKVVPGVGAVEPEDIVKGYEVEKGKYVLITDDEISDVKLEAKHTIDLIQFVGEDEIDAMYFEKPFFVAPDEDEVAGEAYVVLRDALKATRKIGLGSLVARGQASVVALKPFGRGLSIETLRYHDELQNPEQYFSTVPGARPEKELLALATELIGRKAKPFDPKAFKNQYDMALRELIDAKMENRAPHEIDEPQLGAKVIDLMEALKRSVKSGPANSNSAAGKKTAAASNAPTKKSGKAAKAKAEKKPVAKKKRAA